MAKKGSDSSAKSANASLNKRGILHGMRQTKGLTNIPPLSDVGSAAYRRLLSSRSK